MNGWINAPSLDLCATECGAKCCKAPGYMLVTDSEMRMMKDRATVKVQRHDKNQWAVDFGFNGGQCPLLADDNSCSIHEDRPDACRKFPSAPYESCLVWPKEGE